MNAYYAVDLEYDARLEREIQMMDSPCHACNRVSECPFFGECNTEKCQSFLDTENSR